MAHILVRKYPSGSTRYTADIRIRKGKQVIQRESKTFEHLGAAQKWAKAREVALEDPVALIRVKHGAPSVSISRAPLRSRYSRWRRIAAKLCPPRVSTFTIISGVRFTVLEISSISSRESLSRLPGPRLA